MINHGDLAKTIIDQNHNATWSGSIYALKDLLMFVNNNQDIAVKSKVIINVFLTFAGGYDQVQPCDPA